MSGLFRGSQMNWACLPKKAYAIYMSIKQLAYYLEDADITLRSDHLPLRKFLAKNTLNSKVNNWAIKISPFHITFEYIIYPQMQQESEPEGYEFRYYTFDTLPALELLYLMLKHLQIQHCMLMTPNVPMTFFGTYQ